MTASTRELIRQFNAAFDRPINDSWTNITISERELLGKLLLEEAVEYCIKGLGLDVKIDMEAGRPDDEGYFRVEHREGQFLDPIECVDGLADVNVVIHFCAHWHGFNLDKATEIVNESNMSKLGVDGKPIINGCGFAAGSPDSDVHGELYDPSKPIGKILKGPNFVPPTFGIQALIMEGRND